MKPHTVHLLQLFFDGQDPLALSFGFGRPQGIDVEFKAGGRTPSGIVLTRISALEPALGPGGRAITRSLRIHLENYLKASSQAPFLEIH
jgi:hypothetical protein